ncbi:hypothetical protein [uncultured Methanobrevibacter sp.]|uniref:hypothetical protein n=1 Tax=uncultured Methanobrevibacter sp. TaxID=253161 RepID=UPI0032099F92
MTDDNFEQMEKEALEATDDADMSGDYWVTPELADEGWEYDSKRVYIPFPYTNKDHDEIFFSISRKPTKKVDLKYTWCRKKKNGEFKNLGSFKRNKLLNEEEIEKGGKSSINKIITFKGRDSGLIVDEGGYKSFFVDVYSKIIISECLDVLKEDNYEFPPEPVDEIEDDENSYLLEVEEAIEYRQNPILDDAQKKQAEHVKSCINEDGLIGYLKPKLDKLHIGEHRNIYRKLLGAFNVMRGTGSYLFETTAHAEAGKSLEDKIVFSYLVPEEYIFKKNNMTEASFIRYSDTNTNFFTRLIITLGDFGSKKAYQKIEDVFNIIKILITEKEFSKDLSEKNTSGNFLNKNLDLKVDSIGAAYSTTINSFTENDPQLESRTLSSTPFDTDKNDIMDHILYLKTSKSQQSKDHKATIEELIAFKSYLLSLVAFDKEIINPYGSLFKRYVNESNTPIRELEHLLELFDAYCVLTYKKCKIINGDLVASEKQLNDFFSNICLDNVLIPYESDFITMLLAKGKKTEMVVIDDVIDEDNCLNPLNKYINETLESINEGDSTYNELDGYSQRVFVGRLLKWYKLGKTSNEHKENVFFRLTDIKRAYYRYKAYRNINDLGKLLHTLQLKGYLGKLEFKDPSGKNIYYVTPKCENINVPMVLTDEDKEAAAKYLEDIGLGDADKE